jgi:hypothetical protein
MGTVAETMKQNVCDRTQQFKCGWSSDEGYRFKNSFIRMPLSFTASDDDRLSLWDWSLAQEFPCMSKTDKRPSASRPGLLDTDPRTAPAVRDKLGEQLRAMYGKLEQEPLPDRLLALVRQLDQPRSRAKP